MFVTFNALLQILITNLHPKIIKCFYNVLTCGTIRIIKISNHDKMSIIYGLSVIMLYHYPIPNVHQMLYNTVSYDAPGPDLLFKTNS